MSAIEITPQLLQAWPLPQPDAEGDKESRGRVLVVAGSREIPGAAVLAATAALRAGAGKLQIAAPASVAAAIAMAVPEARVIAMPETPAGGFAASGIDLLAESAQQAHAVLAGPGMMGAQASCDFVRVLMRHCTNCTLVLDALAMDALQGSGPVAQPLIVTPHAGEMAHLTGDTKESIQDDPQGTARRAAEHWNCTAVLKGASSFIACAQGIWVHRAGTPGLATSGSGDVLAGIIAGLATRGATPHQAAAWGVALHARAGANLAQRMGPVGYLARELAAELPGLLEHPGI